MLVFCSQIIYTHALAFAHFLFLSVCLPVCLSIFIVARIRAQTIRIYFRLYVDSMCVHIDTVKNFNFSYKTSANSLSLHGKIWVIFSDGMLTIIIMKATTTTTTLTVNSGGGSYESEKERKKKKCETNKTCLHT